MRPLLFTQTRQTLTQTSFNLFSRVYNHHIYSPPSPARTHHRISHIFRRFIPLKPMSTSAATPKATPKDIVERAVAEGQVVIFSKSWCPYSKKAKALIRDKYPQAKLTVIELDERPENDGDQLQDYLKEKTGQRTVPNVFILQKHVGGSDDLNALHDIGAITKLLN